MGCQDTMVEVKNMTNDLLDLLLGLEKDLHRQDIRRSKEKLNEILHDDFEEIGALGKIYDKDQIIELDGIPIQILQFPLKPTKNMS